MIPLSIVVPTCPQRHAQFKATIRRLEDLARNKPVELLGLYDNFIRTIGAKRNDLWRIATGDYVACVHDDDLVMDDYINELLQATEARTDVIVFDVVYRHIDGRHITETRVEYGIEHEDRNESDAYYRRPNHLMAWRREFAKDVHFLDASFGEDSDWAKRLCERQPTQFRIPKTLYAYVDREHERLWTVEDTKSSIERWTGQRFK